MFSTSSNRVSQLTRLDSSINCKTGLLYFFQGNHWIMQTRFTWMFHSESHFHNDFWWIWRLTWMAYWQSFVYFLFCHSLCRSAYSPFAYFTECFRLSSNMKCCCRCLPTKTMHATFPAPELKKKNWIYKKSKQISYFLTRMDSK